MVATPKCPIRTREPCTLCVPGADGPHNCGLVYLVQDDPELLELAREHRAKALTHPSAGQAAGARSANPAS